MCEILPFPAFRETNRLIEVNGLQGEVDGPELKAAVSNALKHYHQEHGYFPPGLFRALVYLVKHDYSARMIALAIPPYWDPVTG